MDKQQIANLLQEELDEIPSLKDLTPDDSKFQLWKDNGLTYFKEFFPHEERWLDSFSDWSYHPHVIKTHEDAGIFTEEDQQAYIRGLQKAEVTIKAALKKLEIFGIKPQQTISNKPSGVTIQILNNLTASQTTQITVNFEQILHTVQETSASVEDKQVAEKYVKGIEEEIKRDNPSWDKVKTMLIWLLGFSKDVFIQLLPYIIQTFSKK